MPAAPKLEQKLRDLNQGLSDKLNLIKEKSASVTWKQVHLYWYTDHGPEHSRAVIKRIGEIIKPLYHEGENQELRLNADELFVLLAACYLHDIGMQHAKVRDIPIDKLTPKEFKEIRKRHPEWSAELIKINFSQELGERYLASVMAISRAHGTDYFREFIADQDYRVKTLRIDTVRCHLLSALLLMGDELDLAKGRVDDNIDEIAKEFINYPPESLLHIYKHHYIHEAKVSDNPDKPRERNIQVRFRFPQGSEDYADDLKNWVWYKLRIQCQATQDILESAGLRWGKVKVIEDDPWDCHTFPPEAQPHLKKETLERRLINREDLLRKIKDYLEDPPPANEVCIIRGDADSDWSLIAEWVRESCNCCQDLQLCELEFKDGSSLGRDDITLKTKSLLTTQTPGILMINNLHHAENSVQQWLLKERLPELVSQDYKNAVIAFIEGKTPPSFSSQINSKIFILNKFNAKNITAYLIEKMGYSYSQAQDLAMVLRPHFLTPGQIIMNIYDSLNP